MILNEEIVIRINIRGRVDGRISLSVEVKVAAYIAVRETTDYSPLSTLHPTYLIDPSPPTSGGGKYEVMTSTSFILCFL